MRHAGAQRVGNACRVAGEVARLVDHADEVLTDQPVGRIG